MAALPGAVTKVNMGCGDACRDGYVGCDIRFHLGMSLANVFPAWELSAHYHDLQAIYSRHMLEHLTLAEVEATLRDWRRALAVGGEVELWVPDLTFHMAQLDPQHITNALWDNELSPLRWGVAGLYGWQRGVRVGDPATYGDVHKMGFVRGLLELLLGRAGLSVIRTDKPAPQHLVVVARKTVGDVERQVSSCHAGIRPDHVGRYRYAVQAAHPDALQILDVGCGCGYGTAVLVDAYPSAVVHAVDQDADAIAWAQRHWAHRRVRYYVGDVTDPGCGYGSALAQPVDLVVCFEMLEHLKDPEPVLRRLAAYLRPDGRLVVSTPNSERLPYNPAVYPYHTRHYTMAELSQMLGRCGLLLTAYGSQHDVERGLVVPADAGGLFLVAVCCRA